MIENSFVIVWRQLVSSGIAQKKLGNYQLWWIYI